MFDEACCFEEDVVFIGLTTALRWAVEREAAATPVDELVGCAA